MAPTLTRPGSIAPQAAAKVVTATLRLELGNTSSVKWFAGIGEYVIDWGPGYRIYFAKDGNALIVLFGGGTKRRQQVDVDRAVALHTEYKPRRAPKAAASKAEKRKR
jgi:putative addiction module killer protein